MKLYALIALLAIGAGAGFAGAYKPIVRSTTTTANIPTPTVAFYEGKMVPSPYREPLAEAGYLEFVEGNIDLIRMYDWDSFQHPKGPAIGLSTYLNGKRFADIATKGRTTDDIAATLVHEATHLQGILTSREYRDEISAGEVEEQFVQTLKAKRVHTTLTDTLTPNGLLP